MKMVTHLQMNLIHQKRRIMVLRISKKLSNKSKLRNKNNQEKPRRKRTNQLMIVQ